MFRLPARNFHSRVSTTSCLPEQFDSFKTFLGSTGYTRLSISWIRVYGFLVHSPHYWLQYGFGSFPWSSRLVSVSCHVGLFNLIQPATKTLTVSLELLGLEWHAAGRSTWSFSGGTRLKGAAQRCSSSMAKQRWWGGNKKSLYREFAAEVSTLDDST